MALIGPPLLLWNLCDPSFEALARPRLTHHDLYLLFLGVLWCEVLTLPGLSRWTPCISFQMGEIPCVSFYLHNQSQWPAKFHIYLFPNSFHKEKVIKRSCKIKLFTFCPPSGHEVLLNRILIHISVWAFFFDVFVVGENIGWHQASLHSAHCP